MRRFYAISASLLVLSGIFLGCTKQAPQNEAEKKDVPAIPNVKIDNPIIKLTGGEPKKNGGAPANVDADKQEKYDSALGDALTALAERKWDDALTAFEAARSFNDTDFVKSEIDKLKLRIEQDGTAKTTVKNIETVLTDGKAEDAVKLANDALKEFGGGDDAEKLVRLRLQADALQGVQKKETGEARFARLRKEAELAREEKNLRAEVLALEQALQAREDDDLQKAYDSIRGKLDTYDASRKKAAEMRRDPGQLEDALAALKDAAAAWDTLQIRTEIDECQLALERRREAVSVANFELRNDVGMPDAGAALADELLPRLKAKFDLIERDQLNRVIDELKLEKSFSDDPAQQQQLGKLAKVRYLVIGNVSRRVGVTVRARLVDVRTGLVVQTAKVVAPTIEEAINQVPDLAKQLMMSDESKMQFDAQQQEAKAAPVVPDNAEVPAAPLPPDRDDPAPVAPNVEVAPPGFADMKRDAFKVLAPPPANFVAPAPEPLVPQRRNRLLFASVEMGDFLFRAGRFGEAQRQFEFALVLAPDNIDLQLRVDRVRPFAPPVVVIAQQPVFFARPRIAVLPFMTEGNPFVVPPSLSYWTPSNLAPYFSQRYEVVDPTEIYWYMGRMGLTMQDLMVDANARRWLGRAVGVRYFVLGSLVETTSFNANTYLLDAELGYLQGSATINVRDPYELKLRLAELAQLTMMTPAERAAYFAAQQQQRFEGLVLAGRIHMDQGRYREALVEFAQAQQIYPYDVRVQTWLNYCQDRVRLLDFELARRQQFEAQQAAIAASRQRQLLLAEECELARRRSITIAIGRSEPERENHLLFRVMARDSMVTQAQFALKTNRFGISVNLFQGALDIAAVVAPNEPAPTPVPVAVFQDFAQARLKAERAAQLRDAQITAARETALRQVREQQLADAQKQIVAERVAAQAKLDAVRAAQAKRDTDAFKAGISQGQNYMAQNKFEAALAAFQGAQRVALNSKQNEEANRYIDIIVQRQAAALGKTEKQLDAERERRRAAEALAKQNEEQYKAALTAAQQALVAKNLDTAQAKFEEAKLLYKTDAVLTGLQKVQSARAALVATSQKSETEEKKASTIKQLLTVGNTALAAQKHTDAVQAFQQAKKLAPDNLEVMTGLTQAEQARDRLQADARRKAEETGRTQNFQRLVKSGRDNLTAKHYEAAVANLSEALKLNPTDADVQAALKQAEKGRDASLTDTKAQTAAKLRGEQYQQLLTAGQVALDSKRYADAIQKFSAAQKLLPGDKTSQTFLQDAQAAQKAAEDARAIWVKQRADEVKKATDTQKALNDGRKALAAKDFVTAGKLLAQAKQISPNDPDVQRALGDLDQATKNADTAVAAQKQRQAQFQTALTSGKEALNAKKFPEALKALSSATTLMPDNKEAQDLLRRAQTEANQAADTAAKDKTLLANYQTAVSAGQKALQTKNYKEAIQSFQQALKLMPNDMNALKLLQQAQDAQSLGAKTEANFEKALDAGQAALTGKKYAEAVKALTEATKLDPNDARARKLLQQAQQGLADANQQATILAGYQKAMTTGQQAMNAKRFPDAVIAYKDALKWIPDDQKAQAQLKLAQQGIVDAPKVKTPVNDPAKQFDSAMQKAAAAEKDKKYSDAVKAYTEALKMRPKDSDALAGLKQNQYALNVTQGLQFLENSMWMAAQTEFEAALRLFPTSDQAKKLLQKAKAKMK